MTTVAGYVIIKSFAKAIANLERLKNLEQLELGYIQIDALLEEEFQKLLHVCKTEGWHLDEEEQVQLAEKYVQLLEERKFLAKTFQEIVETF